MASRLTTIRHYFPVEPDYPKKVQKPCGRQPSIVPLDDLVIGDQYWSIPDTNMVVKLDTDRFASLGMVAGGPAQFRKLPPHGVVQLELSTRTPPNASGGRRVVGRGR